MTKEEIEAQIDIIEIFIKNKTLETEASFKILVDNLKSKLKSSKSIKDLQKEAFEAGKGLTSEGWEEEDYEDWNDYLTNKGWEELEGSNLDKPIEFE